jgi:hypothetical protein
MPARVVAALKAAGHPCRVRPSQRGRSNYKVREHSLAKVRQSTGRRIGKREAEERTWWRCVRSASMRAREVPTARRGLALPAAEASNRLIAP